MIVLALGLFLFGTAVSAGPFIPSAPTEIVISRNRHPSTNKIPEYYPSRDKSPFISNFMQEGTNIFFKPQFVLSASQMPPQIQTMIAAIEKDDCKTSYPLGPVPVLPIVEEPLRIIEKEFLASPEIKEIIEINPMAIAQPIALPKLPLVVKEPCEIQEIVIPEVPLISSVVEVKEAKMIPPAPVLPPLELPKLPLMVEKVPLVPKLVPVPEIPVIVEMEHPKEIELPVIPPAPVLAPLEMPKMPVLLEEPCAPTEIIHEMEFKPIVVAETPILPNYVQEFIVEEKPVVIPQPPELPPFTLPKLPMLIEENVIVEPITPKIQYEEVKVIETVPPMVIPDAPVLPPYVPVELPAPVFIEEPNPISIEIEKEIIKPAVIPTAPVLPAMEMPKVSILVEEANIIPCAPGEEVLTSAPLLTPYVPEVIVAPPTPLVIEEKLLTIPPAPKLPPFSMPKLPVEVVVEENVMMNALPAVEIAQEQIPLVSPEAPLLQPFTPFEIPAPVVIETEFVKPTVLPPAPILPLMTMPEMPIMVQPCDTVEIIEEHVKPIVIPEAPLLPPLAPLTIPAPVIFEETMGMKMEEGFVMPAVIPPAPVLPPIKMPEVPVIVEPCVTVETMEQNVQPILIPEAPLLPPLAPSAIPSPVLVKEPIRVEIEEEIVNPVVLPPAPVLPPLVMPKAPIVMERPAEIVVAPCEPEKEIIVEKRPIMPMPFAYSELSLTKPVLLPPAPVVPEYFVPYTTFTNKDIENCERDVVVEHILPKMKKTLEPKYKTLAPTYFSVV